jgi:hypothetical protein
MTVSSRSPLLGRVGLEMSSDRAFLGRVRRLRNVSAIALGVIFVLTVSTLDAAWPISLALLLGWLLMPIVLGASLRRPEVRLLVALPATLVALGLVAICAVALPADPLARAGWVSITAGITLGGVLGAWFWYRWFPVPSALDAPYSTGRWILIGAHVALVVVGLVLVVVTAIG